MRLDRIQELIELLPERNTYTRRAGGDLSAKNGSVEPILYAEATMDPMFGWTFVKSFLDAQVNLPDLVTESSLLRAYCYHRYSNRDPDVRRAFQLRAQAENIRCTILHCMLLIDKYSFEHIAGELHISLDALKIYADLFWNVRDRLDDKAFISAVVYPETTQVLWVKDYHLNENTMNMALRAALHSGMDTVKQFLGIANQTHEFEGEAHAKTLEAQVVSTAAHSARMGLLHQRGVPSIDYGRNMVQSSKLGGEISKDDDSRLGLGSFGMKTAVLEHFRKISESDVQYRLRLQQIRMKDELEREAVRH